MALREPRARSQHHLHPRNPDPTGSRSFGDPTDQVRDVFHQLAKEQLIPQIANRTRNAISVDRREVFFYQRLRSGRRCSCWTGVESSPHSECPICWSTGWAGGFYKWGTHLYSFDPSRQWYGMNVHLTPQYGVPLWWELEEGKTQGYIEWSEEPSLRTYYGLDSQRLEYRKGDGTLTFTFKLVGVDPTFIPFTTDAFKARILVANGSRFIFRVSLSRPLSTDDSPKMQQFWFRLLTNSAGPPILYVDMPRRNESNVLAEYGVLETFQPIQMVFSDAIQRINLEDLVVRLHDMTRWKVIESSPNDPLNILTSHDIQVRKVFQTEALWNVPL
jgi:hypothetical protein